MCIITGETKSVENTRIFAGVTQGRQFTAYSNQVALLNGMSVAMILPVPNGAKGIQFIDLSAYPAMFDEIDTALFPTFFVPEGVRSNSYCRDLDDALEVFQVGSYKASFAPSLGDLDRIQTGVFHLPPNIRQLLVKTYPETFGYLVCILDKSALFHPLGYIHTPLTDGTLWIPTKHQHGARYEELFSTWDHAIHTLNTSEEGGVQGDLRNVGQIKWAHLPSLEPIVNLRKLTITGNQPNRDVVLRRVVPRN